MKAAPLWTLADCRPSNVDKKSIEGQPKVRLCNYTDVYNNSYLDADMSLMEATAPPEQVERFQVYPGDVIITKDSETNDDIGVPSLVRNAEPGMVCGYHLTLLRPDAKKLNSRYLYWLLESRSTKDFWRTNSFGVTRFSLVSPTVWRLPIRLVSVEQQGRIADYLDHETAEIDAMDTELDRLVETLRERGRAVFSSLHDRHLPTRRLKWLMSEVDVRAGQRSEELPLLSVSIHHGVQPRDESSTNQAASLDLSHYKLVRRHQIVLNRMRAFQGGLGAAPCDGICSPDYSVLQVDENQISAAWAEYVMRSPDFVNDMSRSLRGIGSADQGNVRTPRINVRDLFDLEIPLPSLDEQLRIVAELDEQTAQIDDMIADAQRLKGLLAERRSTLITEVVTGRKEVPT